MSNTEKILEEFDEKFEWTDFSGDIGTHILAKKTSSYATEETERNELRTFLTTSIAQALAEDREKLRGNLPKESEESFKLGGSRDFSFYDEGFNEALSKIKSLLDNNKDI